MGDAGESDEVIVMGDANPGMLVITRISVDRHGNLY